jgi:lipoprotein signal peptidase
MIDRGRYTVVVDFILNFIGEYRWPVWNVADAGISVGVVAILLEMLLGMRHGPQGAATSAPTVEPPTPADAGA